MLGVYKSQLSQKSSQHKVSKGLLKIRH